MVTVAVQLSGESRGTKDQQKMCRNLARFLVRHVALVDAGIRSESDISMGEFHLTFTGEDDDFLLEVLNSTAPAWAFVTKWTEEDI